MNESYTLLEARAHFGDLVIRAQGGQPTIITRYGKPAAMLVPVGEQFRTVTLASGGTVTLSLNAKVMSLSPEDREWVFDLIDMFKAHEASQPSHEAETANREIAAELRGEQP